MPSRGKLSHHPARRRGATALASFKPVGDEVTAQSLDGPIGKPDAQQPFHDGRFSGGNVVDLSPIVDLHPNVLANHATTTTVQGDL